MKKLFFKSYQSDEPDKNVNRTKFIQNRIKMVEKYIPELSKAIYDYTDKKAKTRDSCDKIATILDSYGKAENVTSTIKLQLTDFANVLLDVGTCRDVQVQTMETKVLEELSEHDKLCKLVQNELKLSAIASDREKNWFRQLNRMRENEQDPQQISLAEAEFLKARGESFRSSKNLEEQIDIFEKKRLNSIKEALLTWTIAELRFHTKAIQLFTDAYRIAAEIDVNLNVEEFRNKLKVTETSPRYDTLQRTESILHLISVPFQRKTKFTGTGIPHPSSFSSSNSLEASEASI